MGWDTIAAPAVIAATVSALASVVIAIQNNQRLKAIEKNKRINELTQYRYTKLYSILEEILALESFDYDLSKDHIHETHTAISHLSYLAIKKWELAKPLIDASIRKSTDELIAVYRARQEKLSKQKRTNYEEVRELCEQWNIAPIGRFIGQSIQDQLDALLKE